MNPAASITIVSSRPNRKLSYINPLQRQSSIPKFLLDFNPDLIKSFLLQILDLTDRQERPFLCHNNDAAAYSPEATRKPQNYAKLNIATLP